MRIIRLTDSHLGIIIELLRNTNSRRIDKNVRIKQKEGFCLGKIETNKQQKEDSLLNTAFYLFTTKGLSKTSIAEISEKAGMAKGTFYLYFKDKYDIRNKLISHKSSQIFLNAADALEKEEISQFEDRIIFLCDHIINQLNKNQVLLNFISKNLSWGIFKEALTTNIQEEDVNFKEVYYKMLAESGIEFEEPEVMLFLIVELVSSSCYSAILYKEPIPIEKLKPYLYQTVRSIIDHHKKKEKTECVLPEGNEV